MNGEEKKSLHNGIAFVKGMVFGAVIVGIMVGLFYLIGSLL